VSFWEFGWGGTHAKKQRMCPEVSLSMNRNHAWEEKATSGIDAMITRNSHKHASVA